MDRITATDLARYAGLYVEQARTQGKAMVITHHGEDAAVLVPIETYERLLRDMKPVQLSLPLEEGAA